MTDLVRIAATCDAASGHFDTLPFWHHFGCRTVEHVGREGRVLGVDLSRELIATARRNATRQGLGNAAFRVSDIETFDVADAAGLARGLLAVH